MDVLKSGLEQAAALRCGLESNALPLCASAAKLYGGGAVPAALTRAHNLLNNRPLGLIMKVKVILIDSGMIALVSKVLRLVEICLID